MVFFDLANICPSLKLAYNLKMDDFGILLFPLGPIFILEPLVSGKVLVIIVVRDFEGLMVLSF